MNDGNLQPAAGLGIIRQNAAQPGAPANRCGGSNETPADKCGCDRKFRVAKGDHEERDTGHQQGNDRKNAEETVLQQPADDPGSDRPRQSHDQQQQRQHRDFDPRDLLEKGPQISKKCELTHEQQQDRDHARRDGWTSKQPEDMRGYTGAARRKFRQDDPLPQERKQADRHDQKEGAAPADIGAQQAAKWGGNRCRNRVAGIQQCKCFRHLIMGDETHHDRGGHRPEAADRNSEQCPAKHQDRERRCKGDHDAGHHQERREAEHDNAPVQPPGQAGNQQAGDNRKDAGDGDRLPRITF
ncbi:hypothetical protein D3C86_1300470 [compost metagenome]